MSDARELAGLAAFMGVCFLLKTRFRVFKVLLNVALGGAAIFIALGGMVLAYQYVATQKQTPRPQADSLATSHLTPHFETDSLRIEYEPEHYRQGAAAASVAFSVHRRQWADSRQNQYRGRLAVSESHFTDSRRRRETLHDPFYNGNYTDYWRQIYMEVAHADLKKLPKVYQMFDSLRLKNRLRSVEFADAVVSCVQDIPYVLLHEHTCAEIDSMYPAYRELHQQSACVPGIRFGLQSPSEFIFNLKGDCDTRVVLLYNLLSHYGYDVAILVSEHYGHSVLGLCAPARGHFVPYHGKKYYVWETTQTGYPLGEIDPSFSEMKYWEVALASRH
ncbi:MAG: hypothetical protein MUC97_07930 [Bernardetiaceae bacterium]|nr:hypothetical protein [Bernardetiaceae bacterium]